MDKSKIAMVPLAGVGVFATGWYGGREAYEHNQISNAIDDLAAVEALPRDETSSLQTIPDDIKGKVNELFGGEPTTERGVINRDGVITFVYSEETPQTDYKTIVSHFEAQKERVVDGQGDFAMLTGEISLGVTVLAGIAIAVNKRRKHNRPESTYESEGTKQTSWLRRNVGALTTPAPEEDIQQDSEPTAPIET